ncbi:hypothetical protein ACWCW7_10525 [Nocardia tengchongensis]
MRDMADEVGIAEPEKGHRNALSLDAQRIEYMAYIWGGVYRMESTWWRRFHTAVNASAAVLAAIAGSAGLASLVSHTVAGVLALGAAAMSSVAASVGASTRSTAAQAAAIANMELKEAARRFYFTVAPYLPFDEVRKEFDDLCAHRNRVVASVPSTHLPAYRRKYRRLKAPLGQRVDLDELMEKRRDW